MAIQIQITGLTTQQAQDLGNAFDETIAGRLTAGPVDAEGKPTSLTKAQWVEFCLKRFLRDVVKGWKRKGYEATISQAQSQVEADFQ